MNSQIPKSLFTLTTFSTYPIQAHANTIFLIIACDFMSGPTSLSVPNPYKATLPEVPPQSRKHLEISK